MGFTTAAFIRRNTPELRKKLEELGYKNYGNPFQITDDSKLITTIDGEYVPYNVPLDDSFIDCGTNEELFLAIAALRDDTDENQWFIMDVECYVDISKGTWFQSTDCNGGRHVGTQIEALYCHKATAEELIEHFKEKEVNHGQRTDTTIYIKGNDDAVAYIYFCDGDLCVSVVVEGKQADFHFEPITLKMFAYAYKLHCEELKDEGNK